MRLRGYGLCSSAGKGGMVKVSGKKRAILKKKGGSSLFNGIPPNLPSLWRAYLLTKRASQVGFDWPNLNGILEKLDEELKEFRETLISHNRKRIREEFGDLLFVLTNIARFLRINPEEALKRTIEKFMVRFHYIEKTLRRRGKNLHQSNLIEMDRLWEEAKKITK